MGYRFHPTEEEIIHHYLEAKMRDGTDFSAVMKEVEFCNFEPWQLPEHSPLPSDDQEWYFFSKIAYKHSKSGSKKIERTTREGFWKVSGKDREIYDENSGQPIGKRTALVFYQGHGSNAVKTCWVMHEFHSETASSYQEPFVLCRLKRKSDDAENDKPSSRSASSSRN
ncbi:NAC domain-containing protein 91-like [Mangifera indica]|uniref:NAC domain-containing protein 91-like n=1 Tax=Mangifera indica TaxID=29780 RepID=UPI001CFADC1F|nr:NAC domain-containing protein 91-like [Mangifera indica]